MTSKEKTDAMQKIVTFYGYEEQKHQLAEECAEYIQAVNKLRRNVPHAYDNMVEEIADIYICLMEMCGIVGWEVIEPIIDAKLERQISRIEELENQE